MTRSFFVSLVVVVLGCALSKTAVAVDQSQHDAGHHDMADESGMLMVETDPASPVAGKPVALKLMIHDANGGVVREFDTVHEKLVHLIIVRDGLDEFAHVHPALDKQGNLTITHTFPKAGKYRLFADYKPKDKEGAIAKAQIDISGESSSPAALAVDAPGKITADGLVAKVELKNAKAGQESEVTFRLSNEAGQQVSDLQPYLGARGHIVVISADGTQYVHAHPMDAPSAANEVVFMSHFPKPGIYKGWGQFRLADKVRTLPFVVQIP